MYSIEKVENPILDFVSSSKAGILIFLPAFIAGRIPFWVLFILFFREKMTLGALLCFFIFCFCGRVFLRAYEYNVTVTKATIQKLYTDILRPIGTLVIIEIGFTYLYYTIFSKNPFDIKLAIVMLVAMFLVVITRFFVKQERIQIDSVFPRTRLVRWALALLWLYLAIGADHIILLILTGIAILVIEFLTTFDFHNWSDIR